MLNNEETFGETIEPLRGALGGDDVELRVVFNMTLSRVHSWRDGRELYMAGSGLARDARICNVGAPRRLTLFTDKYVRGEFRLYYGDVEVRGFKSEEAFLAAKLEISDGDAIFRYPHPPDSP